MWFARFQVGKRTLRSSIGRVASYASSANTSWKEVVQDLLTRTDHLVETKIARKGLCSPETQNESYSLFNAWRQVLFQIPHQESIILNSSADHIDRLLHAHLDKLSQESSGKKQNAFNPSPLLLEDMTTGIYAWGRTAIIDKDSPERAEELFQKFLESSKGSKESNAAKVAPTSNMYSALVYCWSQASSNNKAAENCLFWFRKIQAAKNMTVDSATWNALVRVHVRQRKFHGIDPNLLQEYSSLNDGYTYASLVEGWLDLDLPQNAYQELQRGISFCLEREDQIPALQQLLFVYLSRTIQQGRLVEAERVMNQAIDIQEKHMELEILGKKHFVVTMKALAAKGKTDQTNEIFRKLKSLYEQGAQPRFEPNYQVLVILLSAIVKKRDRKSLQIGRDLLSTIETFLLHGQSLKSPITNFAYNVMLDFYVRSPHVSDKREKVEELIERMKKLSVEHENPRLLPDIVSYASLMKAIIKEGKPAVFADIDGILRELEHSNETFMLPDRKIYAIALEALLTFFTSGDNEALRRANDIVERMEKHTKLQPDRVIYTILIKIHSLVNDVHGANQVLYTMIQAFKSGRSDCRPNEEAFVTAMSTWEQSKRTDSPDVALQLFNMMVALYRSGNTDCRPSLKSFGTLMVILAKSEHKYKMERGRRLFSEMEVYNIIPDVSLFNWYIRVCASVNSKDQKDKRESWNEALATFHTLRKKGMTNSHTYNSIFYACANLLQGQDDRLDHVRDIFSKCQTDGQVNRRILTSLRRSLPPKLYTELTSLDPRDNSIQMKQIPASWKRTNANRNKK